VFAPPSPPPPGWLPDPLSPQMLRWWDGAHWTGYQAPMPVPVPSAREEAPIRPMPLTAALAGLAVTASALIVNRVLLANLSSLALPVFVYLLISTVVGYGPMLLFCRWAVRHWGTGSLADDLGLRFRWSDFGWGAVTWLSALGAQVACGIVVVALRIPTKSNTRGISDLRGERGVLIALALSAVIAAPFVEELMFRGLILRGFLSVMEPWMAVGLQGILFGSAHIGPERGAGNIGLVLVLSSVGIVFGGAAYLLRRIGPTIIAHAILNTIALILSIWVLGRS
jgi:membrane protease YdiL (CAAX protease family)